MRNGGLMWKGIERKVRWGVGEEVEEIIWCGGRDSPPDYNKIDW